jgi:hypothetical protein
MLQPARMRLRFAGGFFDGLDLVGILGIGASLTPLGVT